MNRTGRPKLLRHSGYFNPEKEPFKPEKEPFKDMRDTYGGIVWQCQYSGIEVPDSLWRYIKFGRGSKYSENQAENMLKDPEIFNQFDAWTDDFTKL